MLKTPTLRAILVTICLLILGVALFRSSAAPLMAIGDAVPDSYIITLRSDVRAADVANDIARKHGLTLGHVYSYALNGFSATMPSNKLAAVQRDPRILKVVQDRYVSIAAQSMPTGISRMNGDLSSTVSGNGSGSVNVDVAVIDTGIDLDHPDLNVVGGVNCSTGRSYDDGNGHGSHVSGTIAARDNTIGVVGVAPGARLYAVRVLNNQGSGSWASVICGIDWVTARASTIEVANMSLGGSGSEGSCNDGGMHQAICNSVAAGVTYVVAAGNNAANANGFVPATYNEVITVSALADFNGEPGGGAAATCRSDVDDTFANFSNYGSDVDLIAPGVCILSTWKGGGYNTISGTSMASPHVAGAAALYKASNPGATPAQVKAALQNAGNLNWNNADDHDSTKERLVDVDPF
jgi:subtilisin family serine protease